MRSVFKCYRWHTKSVGIAILEAVKERLDRESARALGCSISGDNERTAFFAGAGVSVESGLPNFRQFSEHLLSSTLPRHKDITKEDIAVLAGELRPEVLMHTLHEIYGDKIFDFYKWFEGAPSTYHYALAKALKQGYLVLTTNVDTLIEDAYEELYGEKDYSILTSDTDFDITRSNLSGGAKGVLIKLHGTVDSSKEGPSRYDTVRCTLYRVGEGGTKNMRNLLTHICREFDMIYLGYSGCDNFSIQPILTNAATERTTLWLWYDHPHLSTTLLETPHSTVYDDERARIGELVAEDRSFAEIPRGMEILAVGEILSVRRSAFRVRGDVRAVVEAVVPGNATGPRNVKEGPVPPWVRHIPARIKMRCAARIFSIAGRLDVAVSLLEEVKTYPDIEGIPRQKALVLKQLGVQYVNTSLSSSYEKALRCLEASKIIFNRLGDYENVLETQLDIADTLRQMRQFNEAEEILVILQEIFKKCEHETYFEKAHIRLNLIRGLILGIGRTDIGSTATSIQILEDAAQSADRKGFTSLHAAILNASSLIKYQDAGHSIDQLESVTHDLDTAYQLNLIIGDLRSCFRLVRILGIIWMDLSRLQKKPEVLDDAIRYFRRAEQILFGLSRSRIREELLEVRLQLGKALFVAERLEEAEGVLMDVRVHYGRLGDWFNEAQTLELLVKIARNPNDLIQRCEELRVIYDDVKINEAKQKMLKLQPHTVKRGRYILRTAANCVRAENEDMAMILQKLMVDAFVE